MFYQHNMGAGGWIFMALANFVVGEIKTEEYQRLRTTLAPLPGEQAAEPEAHPAARS